LGLEAAGGKLLTAVERSPMAAETFFHNLIEPISDKSMWDEYVNRDVRYQVSKGLVVKELEKVLQDAPSMEVLAASAPDVVVGGPPCQGFSLAGRRNPEDARNSLPWQFLNLVEVTKPKVVVIENVVGMRHKFGNEEAHVFDQLQTALKETVPGYVVQAVEVNALHYGAPQHRPRLMIIGLRQDIAKQKNIMSTTTLWHSNFLDKLETIPSLAPIPTIHTETRRTVRDALTGLSGSSIKGGHKISSYSNNWGVLRGTTKTPANHVMRRHQPLSVLRFGLYQCLSDAGVDNKTLSNFTNGSTTERQKIVEQLDKALKFPLLTPEGVTLARNKSELETLLVTTQTKKHSQRVLKLDEPARTVVTIGDDYVHPIEPRTFTVRELARFQGFPDAYEFRAKETTGGLNRRNEVPQYSQVGNAVSPMLALAVGKLIETILA